MVFEISEYVPVKRAVEDALANLPSPRGEWVGAKRSYGRVAAEDVICQTDVPPFSSSHMDGFAIRAEDSTGASEARPARFKVVGWAEVGRKILQRLGEREALRVSTGSFLPERADAVVPMEDGRLNGGRLSVRREVPVGAFVFAAGEDVKKGSVVVRKGAQVRAQDVGLLIALGVREIKAYVRPKVAILATGSELTNSTSASPGKTRNSHAPVFLLITRALGCDSVDLGIAPDRVKAILERLRRGLREADLVFTTGGTSVGKMDLAEDVVSKLKPQVMHHGIRMDRGRVAGLATIKGKGVVMMPGPIQGAMNAFLLLGLPMIGRLSGRSELALTTRARLTRRWEARKRFPNFTKVVYLRVMSTKTGAAAEPLVGETESMSLLSESNAFAVVPEDVTAMEAGNEVVAQMLPGFSFSA